MAVAVSSPEPLFRIALSQLILEQYQKAFGKMPEPYRASRCPRSRNVRTRWPRRDAPINRRPKGTCPGSLSRGGALELGGHVVYQIPGDLTVHDDSSFIHEQPSSLLLQHHPSTSSRMFDRSVWTRNGINARVGRHRSRNVTVGQGEEDAWIDEKSRQSSLVRARSLHESEARRA